MIILSHVDELTELSKLDMMKFSWSASIETDNSSHLLGAGEVFLSSFELRRELDNCYIYFTHSVHLADTNLKFTLRANVPYRIVNETMYPALLLQYDSESLIQLIPLL